MKIHLHLNWIKSGSPVRRGFKAAGCLELLQDYQERIARFVPFEVGGRVPASWKKSAGCRVWFCDRGARARIMSSEETAGKIEAICQSGVHDLHVVVGHADGFSPEEEAFWQPDLKWSFGPMTLPHELAAVVAAEQIYRAWSILKNLPYHQGH